MRFDVFEVIHKYTATEVKPEDFKKGDRLAEAIIGTAYALLSTEQQLIGLATRLEEIAARIRQNIDAGPADRVYALASSGELGGRGVQVDVLIAQRAQQMGQLQMLISMWNARRTDDGSVAWDGRTYGQLTPEEQRRARTEAAARLNAEFAGKRWAEMTPEEWLASVRQVDAEDAARGKP